jgi:hypothetical protein
VRVALVAPHALEEPRGNSVTLARLARGLRAAGVRVRLLGPEQRDPSGRLDVVHAFHATKAGPRALQLAQRSGAALVITLTGTDVNLDLRHAVRGKVVRRVLEKASALVVFSAAGRRRLRRPSKAWAGKAWVIPAAVAGEFFACGAAHAG